MWQEVGQANTVQLEQLSICPAIVPTVFNKYKVLHVIIQSKERTGKSMDTAHTFNLRTQEKEAGRFL